MVGRFVPAGANHHRAPLGHGLACTNEATPRGESPEAIRPEARGHTARTRRPHGRESEDTLANRLADPPRSESARRPSGVRTYPNTPAL